MNSLSVGPYFCLDFRKQDVFHTQLFPTSLKFWTLAPDVYFDDYQVWECLKIGQYTTVSRSFSVSLQAFSLWKVEMTQICSIIFAVIKGSESFSTSFSSDFEENNIVLKLCMELFSYSENFQRINLRLIYDKCILSCLR